MCLENMEFKSVNLETSRQQNASKRQSRLTVTYKGRTTSEERPAKPSHTGGVTTTSRKRKRTKSSKIMKVLGSLRQEEVVLSGRCADINQKVTLERRFLSGEMAPENTTQYLMANVYEDLSPRLNSQTVSQPGASEVQVNPYDCSLSPSGVYAALDSFNESCLAFQQRNFEEVFGLYA